MKDLVFVLISSEEVQSNKLRELTIAWSRYGYHGELIEDTSIDQALMKAVQTQARYCLIQSVGHVIDEQWFLPHWQKEGFYQGIYQLTKNDNFLVVGEWFINKQGYAGLDTDCLLIDLQRYRMLGHPVFGQADGQTRTMKQAIMSDQNATHLQSSDRFETIITDSAGWNFIQTSMKHNLPVHRFGSAINDCRFNLAQNTRFNRFEQLLGKPVTEIENTSTLTPDQKSFIEHIKKQVNNAQKGVFLFNIEPYDDLVLQSGSSPLDALFSVAAGFKPYRILFTEGYHDNTQVVLFDYSRKALEVRRHIVECWNGVDFPSFVRRLFARYPQPEVFYQLWCGATPENIDWNDMDKLWQLELNKWGGAESFKQHWQQCRKLPHQYLHCDLLKNRHGLLDEISSYHRSYIWWSNAFFTIYSHWHYSTSERKTQYLSWIKALSEAAPNCQVNGADHNNIAVNGLSAQQYFQQFDSRHCDSLKPQAIHKVDIQF